MNKFLAHRRNEAKLLHHAHSVIIGARGADLAAAKLMHFYQAQFNRAASCGNHACWRSEGASLLTPTGKLNGYHVIGRYHVVYFQLAVWKGGGPALQRLQHAFVTPQGHACRNVGILAVISVN